LAFTVSAPADMTKDDVEKVIPTMAKVDAQATPDPAGYYGRGVDEVRGFPGRKPPL